MSTNKPVSVQHEYLRSQSILDSLPFVVALGIGVLFYSFVLPRFRPYGWVDDWIYAIPLHFTTISEWVTWLFQQHVDHRIPIQKLTNFFILKASGFDYRALVGINFAMAIGVSCMLVEIARRYRGAASLGDIAIPMIFLNFGMGFTQWGFHFHAISLMFFFTSFLYATLIGIQEDSRSAVATGGVFLALAVFVGMNGALVATGAAILVIAWHLARREKGIFLLPHYITVLIGCLILANWSPWSTEGERPDIGAVIDYSSGLLMGAFVMLTKGHEAAKKVAIVFVVSIAAAIILYRLRQRRATAADLLLGAALGIFGCLALSISYGRLSIQGGWHYGATMHYGTLFIYFPVLSWIVISSRVPKGFRLLLSIVFIVLGLATFHVNHQWRVFMINHSTPLQAQALEDLNSDKPVEDIVRDNLMQFLVDEPSMPQAVLGIQRYREAGAVLYGPRQRAPDP